MMKVLNGLYKPSMVMEKQILNWKVKSFLGN